MTGSFGLRIFRRSSSQCRGLARISVSWITGSRVLSNGFPGAKGPLPNSRRDSGSTWLEEDPSHVGSLPRMVDMTVLAMTEDQGWLASFWSAARQLNRSRLVATSSMEEAFELLDCAGTRLLVL